MRVLFYALFILVVVVIAVLWASEDPGYVLVSREQWTVEASLAFTLTALAAAFALLYGAIRLLAGIWHAPGRIRHWRLQGRSRRAGRATERGLIALAEGNWSEAERLLIRAARRSDTPLLNYLGAARAAQKLGSDARRDEYLSQAHRSMPNAELAVGLTQAEVQLSQGQAEQALATLRHLHSIAPKHSQVLHLLKRLYERLESWGDLRDLLPQLRAQRVFDEPTLKELGRKTHYKLLQIAAASGRIEQLKDEWERVPRNLRHDPQLVQAYVKPLVQLGRGAEAEPILRETLKRQLNPELTLLYGTLEGADAAKQLSVVEGWLKQHERQADLLLTAGRLALRNELWGKARSYLEASLGVDPRPETYNELGHLLAQLGERGMAYDCFRKGLDSAVGTGVTRYSLLALPHKAQLSS